MRWPALADQEPDRIPVRVVARFALWPVTIGDARVWLGWYASLRCLATCWEDGRTCWLEYHRTQDPADLFWLPWWHLRWERVLGVRFTRIDQHRARDTLGWREILDHHGLARP